jgi:uncharacterized protein YndB with AHSA1/START domain
MHRGGRYRRLLVSHTFEVVVHADAPRERVWALLADARGWARWARFSHARLEREGSPAPDGVGALRVFGTGPFNSREEVVAFAPPEHLAYELRRGIPIKGYRADVTLEPDGDGTRTRIVWSSRFERATVPGTAWFFRWFLRAFIADTARRLARAAAVDAPGS